MKTLKKFNPQLATFLALTFLFGLFESCSRSEEITETLNEIEFYSGEQIFRAIFFLEGNLVDKIPSLRHTKVERDALLESPAVLSLRKTTQSNYRLDLNQEILGFRNKVVKDIDVLNPNIFGELKSALNSNDVNHLSTKITEAAALMNTVIMQNEQISNGVRLADLAFKQGGIDPSHYEFTTVEGVQKYNEDVIDFLKREGLSQELSKDETAGVVFIFLVVAFFLVAAAAYLAVLIGGGALLVIGGLIFIEVKAYFEEGIELWSKTESDDLAFNIMVAEMIELSHEKN